MVKGLRTILICLGVFLFVLLCNVKVLFSFGAVGESWISRPGTIVTVNATTPVTIVCPYANAELVIYSANSYYFNFDSTTMTTPSITTDPRIPSGNFFTTDIRYKIGNVGRVLSAAGTATLRLFWSLLEN